MDGEEYEVTHQKRDLLLCINQLRPSESPVVCHDNLFSSLIVCLFSDNSCLVCGGCLVPPYTLHPPCLYLVPPCNLHLALIQAAEFVQSNCIIR